MADKKIEEAKEKAQEISDAVSEKSKEAAKAIAGKVDEYYSKLPLDQETKDKAKEAAEKAAQKTKQVGKAAAEKLDEYYNKLPLDEINEKLGGKVDVKSTMFKRVLAGIVGFILVLFLYQVCTGSSEGKTSGKNWDKKIAETKSRLQDLKQTIDKRSAKLKEKEPELIAQLKKDMENEPIPEKYGKIQYQNQRLLLHLAKTDKKLFDEYSHARSIAAGSSVYPEGHTPREFINIIKQHKTLSFSFNRAYNVDPHEVSNLKEHHKSIYEYEFNQRKIQRLAQLYKDVTILEERHSKLSKQLSSLIANKYLAEQKALWPQTKTEIETRAPSMINEKLDETFDTCKMVKINTKPFYYRYDARTRDEWWSGVATLHNSRTGKNKKRKVEVMYGRDTKNDKITCVVTLKNERP